METTFQTNLNCGSCVASVKPHLDAIDDIRSWDVDTNAPTKTLRVQMKDDSNTQSVVDAVAAAGFEATPRQIDLEPSRFVTLTPPAVASKPTFRLATYRPLLIVLAYLIAGCAFLENLAGDWNSMRAMRHFMGLFFAAFAFFKLLDVGKFADAFATYDVVARRSRLYAVCYPFLELALGTAFLLDVFPLATNVITAAVMGVGLIGVIDVVRRGQTIQCACLGTAFNLPMSSVTIIENTVMLVMAIVGAAASVLS